MCRFIFSSITIAALILSSQTLSAQGFSFWKRKQPTNASTRKVPCDSHTGVPCDAGGPTIAIPVASQHPCQSKNCQKKDKHIHIHLTQEQVQQLLAAQSQTTQTQQQPVARAQTAQVAQQGSFVAPPATGSVVEESVSRGWRGPVIRFPEFKIGLPSIELPSRFRVTNPRRMIVDSTQAAYVPAGQQAVVQTSNNFAQNQIAVQAIPQQQIYAANQTQTVDTENVMQQIQQVERMKQQLSEKEKLLEKKLRQCEQLLQQYNQPTQQRNQPQNQQPYAQPQFHNGCDSQDVGHSNQDSRRRIAQATPQEQRSRFDDIKVDPDLKVKFIPQLLVDE